MSSEKDTGVSVKLGIVLALFLGLVGGLIFAYNFVPRQPAEGIAGKDIATATSTFVRDAFKKDGEVFSILECSGDSCQPLAVADRIPNHAWRMLAFVGSMKVGDGSAKEALSAEFDRLDAKSDLRAEQFSLHQVYEAYDATGDEKYLYRFVESAAALSDRASSDWLTGRTRPPIPMLAGAAARELAQLYGVLGKPEIVSDLQSHFDWFPKEQSILDFMRANALKGATELSAGIPEDHEQRCFRVWGNYALYEATNDAKWLSDVESFFEKNAGYLEGVTIAQHVLPCLDVLSDLSAKDQRYDTMFRKIAQSTILRGWDASDSKKCSGDNGFLSLVIAHEGRKGCDGAQKFLVDSAWAAYIFSKRKDLFEVL